MMLYYLYQTAILQEIFPGKKMLEITIAELQKLRESEDHIEFKEAKHNYPFAGGKHVDLKDRRRCVLLPWRMKRVDDWY